MIQGLPGPEKADRPFDIATGDALQAIFARGVDEVKHVLCACLRRDSLEPLPDDLRVGREVEHDVAPAAQQIDRSKRDEPQRPEAPPHEEVGRVVRPVTSPGRE